jgi:dTDP-4-dehydrorhamnose 3,5-epimerase
MLIEQLGLSGVMLSKLETHSDNRGSFSELLSPDLCSALGVDSFPQVNISESAKDVFRGIRLQAEPYGQAKLIHCLSCSIIDFVLDVNPSSPRQGEHISIELKEGTGEVLFIPSHYAHGFVSKQACTKVPHRFLNYICGCCV